MGDLKKFEYEGHTISFDFGDGHKMINATEMAKPFGKRVNNFLQNQQTKEYITFLEARYWNSSIGISKQVLRIVKGGSPELQGTWMEEKLALKFAAWLSIEFEVWVYDRIHELLTTGKTELSLNPTQNIIKNILLIADQLEAHEKDIQELKEDVNSIKDYVGDLEAKILSIDENYYSISGYCALNKIECPQDKALAWGRQASKLSAQKGIAKGKAYDAKYGEVNTYHVEILNELFKAPQ